MNEKVTADFLAHSASEVFLPVSNGYRILQHGYVAALAGRVQAVGEGDTAGNVSLLPHATVLDCTGKTITPGLVDAHTHPVFAGWRDDEFELRIQGAQYKDILASGGGIMSSVRKTRAASEDELLCNVLSFLDEMLSSGTTTIEAKSGYGLDLQSEIKSLNALKRAAESHPVEIVPTFLVHSVPTEYKGNRSEFINLVTDVMIPEVAHSRLAEFADVFCEDGVFSVEESRTILTCASSYGLKLKIHADELESTGGAELAAELGAVSADHLIRASDKGLSAMAARGVVAVLLPGTPFFLMSDERARARFMKEQGVTLAIATDFNPGTSPTTSLPLVISLACLRMGMTPGEALWSATKGGAMAIGRDHTVGALEPGMQCDLVVFDCPSHRHIAYRYGVHLVDQVVKRGKVVFRKTKGVTRQVR